MSQGEPKRPGPETGVDHLFNEVQLLLSEKRTSLSVLRTGLAMFAIPLSVISVLIATSKYYDPSRVLALLLPVLVLSAALVIVAIYMVARSIHKLHVYDRRIAAIKLRSDEVARLMS